MAQLLRRRIVHPGGYRSGSLRWATHRGGEKATVCYEADLRMPTEAWLHLRWQFHSNNGGVVEREVRLRLETTTPHFGGLRWWFVCPEAERRARVLYLPPGATTFASRQAHALVYRSQRQSKVDRLIDRAEAARRKLGIDDVDLLEMPECRRPKGMHWHTYDRLCKEIAALKNALRATAPI